MQGPNDGPLTIYIQSTSSQLIFFRMKVDMKIGGSLFCLVHQYHGSIFTILFEFRGGS